MLNTLVGFLLKKIPRTLLQRISRPFFKIISIFYTGNNVECPICRKSFKKFFPYGREARDNALCTNCLSLERHRLIYLYLKRKTSIFTKDTQVLHIAPEACLIDILKKSDNIEYTSADLYSPLADIKMDIHNMPLDDNNFDFILCNHVLEHVENDIKALSEIKRVLKKGGRAIVQVPFYHPIPDKTIEDKSITSKADREKIYGQDDHVRKYGKDYYKRLKEVGFKTMVVNQNKFLSNSEQKKYGLDSTESLYVIEK